MTLILQIFKSLKLLEFNPIKKILFVRFSSFNQTAVYLSFNEFWLPNSAKRWIGSNDLKQIDKTFQ